MNRKNNMDNTIPNGIFTYSKEIVKNNNDILQIEINFPSHFYTFTGYNDNNNLLLYYGKQYGPYSVYSIIKPDFEKMINNFRIIVTNLIKCSSPKYEMYESKIINIRGSKTDMAYLTPYNISQMIIYDLYIMFLDISEPIFITKGDICDLKYYVIFPNEGINNDFNQKDMKSNFVRMDISEYFTKVISPKLCQKLDINIDNLSFAKLTKI